MLFWLGWIGHNTNALFQTADASGPFRRAILLASCSTYQGLIDQYGSSLPLIKDVLGINSLLSDATLCPPS